MQEVVIVSGSRTAIGTFGGGLKDVPVTQFGVVVMKDAFKPNANFFLYFFCNNC